MSGQSTNPIDYINPVGDAFSYWRLFETAKANDFNPAKFMDGLVRGIGDLTGLWKSGKTDRYIREFRPHFLKYVEETGQTSLYDHRMDIKWSIKDYVGKGGGRPGDVVARRHWRRDIANGRISPTVEHDGYGWFSRRDEEGHPIYFSPYIGDDRAEAPPRPQSSVQEPSPVSWSQLPNSGGWRWQDTARDVAVDLGTDWLRDQIGLQPNQRPGADLDPGQWLPGGTPGLQRSPGAGGFDFGGFQFPITINNNQPEQDQSWWERILDKVIDGVGGGIGTAVGTATTRAADGFLGNPSPGQLAGQYFSDAFPGTNPWERLGSQAAQAGTQQKLKQQELATRVQVARIAAQGQVQAAKESARPGLKRAEAQNPLDEARTRQVEAHIQPQVAKWSAEEKLAIQQAKLILQQTDIAKTDAFYRALEKETGIDKNRFGYLLPILNTLDMDPTPELTPMGDALRGEGGQQDVSRAIAKAIVGLGVPAGFAIRYAAELKKVAGFLKNYIRHRPTAVESRRILGQKARKKAEDPNDSHPNAWMKN